MKRGILLVVLFSFLGMATYAQTKPKTKPKPKPKTAKSAATKPKVDTSKNRPVVTSTVLADTTKKGIPPNFTPPLDGYYVKSAVSTAKPTPYPSLREADVVFQKRIWREIDLRERMNQYMASPKGRLIDVLMDAISAGELTAYDPTPNPGKDDPNGDQFQTPLTAEQAKIKLADSVLVQIVDKATGDVTGTRRAAGEFNPDSIIKFRIKEDWIFDRQRSVFEPRIIGIAPLIKIKAAGLESADYQPAFWINFPEARRILATKEIVMRHNDASGLSFDQAFLKRIFSSYIVKQSNEKDERIKDYMQGIDRLYEAERIKKSLMDWELDLWKYNN